MASENASAAVTGRDTSKLIYTENLYYKIDGSASPSIRRVLEIVRASARRARQADWRRAEARWEARKLARGSRSLGAARHVPLGNGDAASGATAQAPKDTAAQAPNLLVALDYVAIGIAVFPLQHADVISSGKVVFKAKKPLIKWKAGSSTDSEVIRRWWQKWPNALVALDLGKAGLVVIDPDRHEGGVDGVASWEAFAEQHGGNVNQPVTDTANGGNHRYFWQPKEKIIGCPGALKPAGICVKGRGGYAVAAGSVLPDGRAWRPAPGTPNLIEAYFCNRAAIPVFPAWLTELVAKKQGAIGAPASQRPPATKREQAYAKAALATEAKELAETPQGGRNDQLNKSAFLMGTMVGAGWIERDEVETALSAACDENGLGGASSPMDEEMNEFDATFESGMDSGIESPRLALTEKDADKFFDKSGFNEKSDGDAGTEKEAKSKPKNVKTVLLQSAADVRPEAIEWIWKYWLARRCIQIIAGTKGDGKSTLAFYLAAIVSRGGTLPDGSKARQGRVLIWSGEDDIDTIIVPRLIAMNADLTRISFIPKTQNNGKSRPFDPAQDLPELATAIEAIPGGVDLIIIDPLVATIGNKDSHKNAEARMGLQPLVDLGIETRAAILGVHHFSKGTAGKRTIDRVSGSLAFGALARVVLATAAKQDKEKDGPPRVVIRAESNIGPKGGGFGYDIIQTTLPDRPDIEISKIQIIGPLDGSAEELLGGAEEMPNRDRERKDKAEANRSWLRAFLLARPDRKAKTTEIRREAAKRDITEGQLRRAKDSLGLVTSIIDKSTNEYAWALPED